MDLKLHWDIAQEMLSRLTEKYLGQIITFKYGAAKFDIFLYGGHR